MRHPLKEQILIKTLINQNIDFSSLFPKIISKFIPIGAHEVDVNGDESVALVDILILLKALH